MFHKKINGLLYKFTVRTLKFTVRYTLFLEQAGLRYFYSVIKKRIIMRIVIVLVLSLLSFTGYSQTAYEKGMDKAFKLWGEGKSVEASNIFERISAADSENWIPMYYVAHVNVIDAFMTKDKQTVELKLEKAKTYLDKAKAISPDNAELMVLEALYNTAWIAFDGATYGMTLSGPTIQLYEKALQLAPNNPRVVYSYAEWNIGGAKYFGKDTSVYCKDLEKALALYKTFKNDTPYYPSWGEDRALHTYTTNCK